MKIFNYLLFVFLLLCNYQRGNAQSVDRLYSSSWTVSSLPLLDGVAQIRGEFASNHNIAFGLIGGAGVVDGMSSYDWYDKGPHSMFLLGAQIHYYLFGNFAHGMQIGAQSLFSTTNKDATAYYYRSGKNLYLAPYLGYKVILDPGFTVNAQAGAGADFHRDFYSTKIDINTNQRDGYYMTTNRLYVLLHLDFGWSF